MKANYVTKFLSIIFLSFLLFSVSYGKISKDYYDAIFDGCMEESLKISNNYDLSKLPYYMPQHNTHQLSLLHQVQM